MPGALPSTHRSIALTMPEPGQGEAQIGLTRPLTWLAGNGLPQPALGDTFVPEAESAPSVWLDVAELGLHGWATVKSIGPCPIIDPGPGRVITATIRHASAEVWHLQADLASPIAAAKSSSIPSALAKASPLARTLRAAAMGLLGFAAPLVATAASLAPGIAVESLEAAPALQHSSLSAPASTVVIRPTGQHPFWSETRLAWVPARDLRVGEALRTQSGTTATVTLLDRELGAQPVFNLEVETEHVYFVSEAGVLVHNSCANHLHHTICKTMGGVKNQKFLSKLSQKDHVKLHALIDAELDNRGIPLGTRGGRGNSYRDWDKWLEETPGNQQKAFDSLNNVYRDFDASNGTSVWQDFQNELRAGGFKIPNTDK